MKQESVILSLAILLALYISSATCSPSCTLCKTVMSTIRGQITGHVTETEVVRFVKSTCDNLFITGWCNDYLYPYFDEIFMSLRDDKTDSIACNRVNLCTTRITSVTGEIMFAQGDKLSRIIPIGDHQVQKQDLFNISHPDITMAVISGLSCSPDYCAVLLKGLDATGKQRYATTALSSIAQIPHILDDVGNWYGPWYDANTDEFWMAYGTPANFNFGIFDASTGTFYKRISTRLYIPQVNAALLSGSVLNRLLYFTVVGDYHVWVLDLSLHVFVGNITLPMTTTNVMLQHNPVTQILYGYHVGPEGVFRFNNATQQTKIASIDFTGIGLVPSSTIDPTQNVLWISLWNIPSHAWMKISLNQTTDNVRWTPTGSVEGYFDFNPFVITRVDE